MQKIAHDLSHDLQQFQTPVLLTDTDEREQEFLTASRDLHHFQKIVSQMQMQQIEIVAGEPMLVTLFSPQKGTLYIPIWLIDVLPRTMFQPNQSFYRARPASLAWLFIDAVVATTNGRFQTVHEHYAAEGT
jgi:hypothetical protein